MRQLDQLDTRDGPRRNAREGQYLRRNDHAALRIRAGPKQRRDRVRHRPACQLLEDMARQ